MNTAKRACGLMLILAAVCMLNTGCLILNDAMSGSAIRFLFAAPIYAALIWTVNLLLLKKERSVTLLFAVGAAACIIYLLPCYLLGLLQGAMNVILALAIAIAPAALAPYLNLTTPKLSQCILMLEGALVLLLLEGLVLPYRDASPIMYFWGIVSVCTAMLCLLLYRMEGGVTLRSVLLLAGLFLGLAAIAALLLWGGASAAGGGLVSLWQGIAGAAAKLWKLIEAAAQKIASLFHPETVDEGMTIDLEQGVVTQAADSTGETANVKLGFLAIVILLVILAAVIFIILRLFGKAKVGGRQADKQKDTRKRNSLSNVLRMKLSAFQTRLSVNRWLRRHRNEPIGIFYLMEKTCRRSALARKKEETPADFIRKVAAELEPADGDAALAMIPSVNRSIFSDNAVDAPVPQAGRLLKAAKTAARKSRLPHGKAK